MTDKIPKKLKKLKEKTAKKVAKVLEALISGDTKTVACKKAHITLTWLWMVERDFEGVKEAVEEALERGYDAQTDVIESKLHEIAEKGNVVALMFWLANRRKHRWQSINKVEVSGKGGGPLKIVFGIPPTDPAPEKEEKDENV